MAVEVTNDSIKHHSNEVGKQITEHMQQLRAQMFEIKCQVLRKGDTYTTKTGEGETVVTVDADGQLPAKKNFQDAGFDLFTPYDVTIAPGEVVKIPLNIRLHLPANSWARIETKSGLGSKGMLVYAGVVDEPYRGIPHVIATNLNHKDDKPIVVKAGQKLAQMTMNPHRNDYYITEVESVSTDTARGEGGFGSTGK